MTKNGQETNDIEGLKKTLAEMGFHSANSVNFANINGEGCYIKGIYTGETYDVDDEYGNTQHHYKFTNAEGIGLDKDGNKKELKLGDYVVFRSGLLDTLLKDKAGKEVVIIYKGKKEVKIDNKKRKVNQYELLVKE